ncbi:HEAT repeat domain-containing protein [Paenibacillus lutrae]|uniref:HEAT repeat domain-containing protein n=1 Tax=Paenibacillus lutrae TaxID=2078573 RepID=A0A7X3K0F2_9BACL|nr:HEAT repeat domain-containing protein [Paenibacillus lutrae]MVP01030.1 HEAT repeat domain-containing protein [Paenibacillus lutrae]
MSTALLQELHTELRRLYIAGSELAAGDFRLKKLLPQFQQLGERAPVFKKLGEGIQRVLEPSGSGGGNPSGSLQDLGLLLSSVLHTQGTTSPAGEPGHLKSRPVPLSTSYSYRKISAVREALATTGSGRYEIVTEAFREGLFQDLRLFNAAIAALSDPYAELADFAMTSILPAYGPVVVPHLTASFDRAGGKAETRKLRVIAQAGGQEVLPLIFEAAENGSEDVRVTAIGLLAGYGAYVQALLGWTREKRKPIREAAYQALAAGGSAEGAERLHEAFSGKDIELAAEAAVNSDSEVLLQRLVRDLDAELKNAESIQEDKKAFDLAWERIRHYLRALNHKQHDVLDELFTRVLEDAPRYLSYGWKSLVDDAARYAAYLGPSGMLGLLLPLYKQDARYVSFAFRAAFRLLSPSRLYEEFKDLLVIRRQTKEAGKRQDNLMEVIENQVVAYRNGQVQAAEGTQPDWLHWLTFPIVPSIEEMETGWDSRWLERFIELEQDTLVSIFARPGHTPAQQFLLRQLSLKPELRNRLAGELLLGLDRAEVEEEIRREALVSALEDKRNKNCYLLDGYVFEKLCMLPKSYEARLKEALPLYRSTAEKQIQFVVDAMSRNQPIVLTPKVKGDD